jgi:hypothetical protein
MKEDAPCRGILRGVEMSIVSLFRKLAISREVLFGSAAVMLFMAMWYIFWIQPRNEAMHMTMACLESRNFPLTEPNWERCWEDTVATLRAR